MAEQGAKARPRGRRPLLVANPIAIQVYFDEKAINALDAIADKEYLTRSSAIRQAVDWWIVEKARRAEMFRAKES